MSNILSGDKIWFIRRFFQENQTTEPRFILTIHRLSNFKVLRLGLIIEQIPDEKISSFPSIEVNSNRQAFKTCLEHLSTHEFLWLQFYLSSNDDDEQSMVKITKYLKKLYEEIREDSIVIGIFNGKDQFSRCFIRFKDEEKFLPLMIDGKEYPFDLKLTKT